MKRILKMIIVRSVILNRFLRRLKYTFSNPVRCIHDDTTLISAAENVTLRQKPADRQFNAGIVRDYSSMPWYTKFKRFLEYNDLNYGYVNMQDSDWVSQCRQFSCILWRPLETPWDLAEAKEKIWFIEKILNIPVYPTFDMIMLYGNKYAQYDAFISYGLPAAETFISSDYDEAAAFVKRAEYPLVYKASVGSASQSVRLIKNRRKAMKFVNAAFKLGIPEYWPGYRTKNRIIFQEFIPNDGYDLRVTYVDDNYIFGYYRKAPPGDFRASGLSETIRTALPHKAMEIAREFTLKSGFVNCSVDMVKDSRDGSYRIIEASPLIRVITDVQLCVNNEPGRYVRKNKNNYEFVPGRWWLQEVILKKFMETRVVV